MKQLLFTKKRQPLTEKRLWNTAEKSSLPDGHWIWMGNRYRRSYGDYGVWGKETAHRAAYRFHYGFIPPKMSIKHTCGNTLCLRPSHLIAAPHGPQKGRIPWNKGKRQSRMEAFARHVIRTPDSQCWGWRAHMDKDGYPIITNDGKPMRAHRVSYELHYGPIPKGMFVLHHCDNPPCTNPQHLFLGNTLDNALDASRKGRLRKGITHHSAKLTEEQVIAIREIGNSKSQRDIAAIFGITQTSVGHILRRENWKHL